MKIAVVTDSHLSPRADAFNRNWRAVRDFVEQSSADLTVHLGNITVDGASDPSHFDHVRRLSIDWPTRIMFLPGNHDIGDNPPGPGQAAAEPLSLPSLTAYRQAFGRDYWSFEANDWVLFGVDAQLLGTGTPEEHQQWAWLEAEAAARAGRPAVLFIHKPLFQDSWSDDRPHHRYVPALPRRRLVECLAALQLRAVISGHTHQYLDRTVEGIRHVWVPSTAFFLPDEMQDRIGEKITGLALLDLAEGRARVTLVCPDGVERHNALDHPVYPKLVEARERLRRPAS